MLTPELMGNRFFVHERVDFHVFPPIVPQVLIAFEMFQLAPESEEDFDRENELIMPESFAETYLDHGDCELPEGVAGVAEAQRRAAVKRNFDASFIPLPRSILPRRAWHRIEIMYWGLRNLKTGLLGAPGVKRPFVKVIAVLRAHQFFYASENYD